MKLHGLEKNWNFVPSVPKLPLLLDWPTEPNQVTLEIQEDQPPKWLVF